MKAAFLLCALAGMALGAPAETFTLAGSVVNDATGEPVRRATVGLQCATGQDAASVQNFMADASGRFQISNLNAGKCTVWSERRGFARKGVAIEIGPSLGEVALRLTPYGALTGKVADENGDPMIGVNVQVLQSTISMGSRVLHPANSTSTNDLGEYRLGSLQPGRYYVSAAVPVSSPGNLPGAERTVYARTYYAGSFDFSGATPIEVPPGRDASADFRMQPTHGYTIRGRIANMPQGPFNGLMILNSREAVDSFNGSSRQVQSLAQTGEFLIQDVTPGQYTLSMRAVQGPEHLEASQDVTVSEANVEDLVVNLNRGSEVTGTVRADDKAGPGMSGLDPQRVGIILSRKVLNFNAQPAARLRADWTFTMPQVTPGEYVLNVTVQEPYYVKSAVMGGAEVASNPITVVSGAPPSPLEIVIGSNGGEVNGTVLKDDKPAGECSVLLLRRDGGGSAPEKIARTDNAGKFTVKALAPGSYVAYAWADVNTIEYRNPEILQRYWGENVNVPEGAKQTIQLKLNPD